MNNSKPPQCERVLSYMQHFGEISQLQALRDLGVMRLASRISELRLKYGINIKKEMRTVLNRFEEKVSFAVYSLGE